MPNRWPAAFLGCLFGSKNLKAVVVKGTGMVSTDDPLRFLDLCRIIDKRIMAHPEFQDRHDMGSTLLTLVSEADCDIAIVRSVRLYCAFSAWFSLDNIRQCALNASPQSVIT